MNGFKPEDIQSAVNQALSGSKKTADTRTEKDAQKHIELPHRWSCLISEREIGAYNRVQTNLLSSGLDQ